MFLAQSLEFEFSTWKVRFLTSCEFSQRSEQAVHFFRRVVVHQADAQDAALGLNAKTFGKVHGVKVAVPREDSAIAEKFRHCCWIVLAHTQGNRGAAFFKAFRVRDAVDLYSPN